MICIYMDIREKFTLIRIIYNKNTYHYIGILIRKLVEKRYVRRKIQIKLIKDEQSKR